MRNVRSAHCDEVRLAIMRDLRRRTCLGRFALIAGLIVLLTARGAWAAGPDPRALRFVQICDTQLGFGAHGYEADVESFRQAVRQVNELKPDFAVICGDLVNTATAESFADFKEVLAECEVPCHCVAGNHDVGSPPDPRKLDLYRQAIGKDYYSFENKGYTFLVVNTQFWKSPVESETSQHDTWFVQSLTRAKESASPVFVVGHHPLFTRSADEKDGYYNIPTTRREEILGLFVQHGVLAMLGGHTHRLYDNEHQGIRFLNGETTSKNFDKRPLGFRLWEIVGPDSVKNKFVPLDGQDEPAEED